MRKRTLRVAAIIVCIALVWETCNYQGNSIHVQAENQKVSADFNTSSPNESVTSEASTPPESSEPVTKAPKPHPTSKPSEDTVSDNTVPEDTVPEVTVPEVTVPEDTVSDNTLKEESVSGNTVSDNSLSMNSLSMNRLLGEEPHLLPLTIDEYKEGETYTIKYNRDFLILQELSKTFSFANINFQIASPDSGNCWELDKIIGEGGVTFEGIGSDVFPFQGSIRCAYDSGITFQFNKPLFCYLGNGAVVDNLTITCINEGGSASIADKIAADSAVTIKKISVLGAVSNKAGYAGGLVAEILGGSGTSTLFLQDITIQAAVTGQNAGGLVGYLGKGARIETKEAANPVKVTGMVTGSASAGGITGICDTNYLFDMDNKAMQISAKPKGNGNTAAAGSLIGILQTGKTFTLDAASSSEITITSSVTGNGVSGGIVGRIEAGTLEAKKPLIIKGAVTGFAAGGLVGEITGNSAITLEKYTSSAAVTASGAAAGGLIAIVKQSPTIESLGTLIVTGSVSASSGSAGGIIGKIETNGALSLPLSDINTTVTGKNAGGLIGELVSSKVQTMKAIIKGTVSGTMTGGILGRAGTGSCMELQGESDVSGCILNGTTRKGYIAGEQEEALLYFGKGAAVTTPASNTMDEVGNYGGVYRNPEEPGLLIGDGTLANCGVINRTVSGGSGAYSFATASDFICLTIVLHTQGRFGREAFPGASAESLLASTFQVTANVDLSYALTGIVTLNRNDKQDAASAFKGSLLGTSAVTITKNINNRQERVGLFSTLGNSTFEQIIIEGTITQAKGAGGLAYQSIGSTLTLKNVTSKVKMENLNTDTNATYGGFLAETTNKITIEGKNLTLSSILDTGANGNASAFITKITESTLNLDGITILAQMQTTSTGNTGGFLGHTWNNTGGSIKNTKVQGAKLVTGGTYGALLFKANTKAERLTLDTITYESAEITGNNKPYCSLLISEGTSLVLEVIDYNIKQSACTVTRPGNSFDEVIGKTWSGAVGGIVSLHSRTKNYPDYHYENKVIPATSKNTSTRYYYDLFQHLENPDGTVKDNVKINVTNGVSILDSSEKVLLWNVVHMAMGGAPKDYLKRYYTAGSIPGFTDEKIELNGNLDMSNYSLYSTQGITRLVCQGENAATVTFAANDWADAVGQHNNLQSGLLANPNGVTIRDITLKGNVMNLGVDSGALINSTAPASTAERIFANICLDNLWIQKYEGNSQAVGLLLDKIPSGTASFEKIEMKNYPNNSATKAAAALIGAAGSANEKNLTLNFKEMKIADGKEGIHNGNVLAYASFIYQYSYTDETSSNKGRGLYLFTESDATAVGKLVTFGSELDADTEYQDNSKKVLAELNIVNTDYKPYVFQSKNIEVNPKTGDILKGCGTYEDPYLIDSTKQFLTLYRYMNEAGTEGNYQYQDFYEGFSIIKTGTDETFCGTKHTVTKKPDGTFEGNGWADARTFPKKGNPMPAGFPTPEELSRAYYKLEADIDLQSDQLGNTYKIIAQEFVGFGTENRPFVGVWIGGGKTITLPDKKPGSTYATYGLFQYVKGAVIKDLIIKSPVKDGAKIATQVTTMGGSVAACILGGDNIIDNVTVNTTLQAMQNGTKLGGYVGDVKKGSLILRNVTDEKVKNFIGNGEDGQPIAKNSSQYKNVGQLIGKAEDGFAIYEGAADNTTPLWKNTAAYPLKDVTYQFLPSPSFEIINAAYMNAQTSGMSTSKVTADGKTTISVSLPNEASLCALALSLNADALSIQTKQISPKPPYVSGYNEVSRCRKGSYQTVGNCSNDGDPDYVQAAAYDNANAYTGSQYIENPYPYVYRNYYHITEADYADYIVAGEAILNTIASSTCRTTYTLEANRAYDMSVWGNSFRGIGAAYTTGDGYGGTFRADFDGKGSTIKLAIERIGATDDCTMAGLFNQLRATKIADADYAAYGKYALKNFTLQGSVKGNGMLKGGAAAAEIFTGQYLLEGISVDQGFSLIMSETASAASTGGLIGEMTGNTVVSVKNCKVGKESAVGISQVELKGKNTGGLIGHIKGGTFTVDGSCAVNNLTIKSGGNVGGIIGFSAPALSFKDTVSVRDSCIETTSWNAGGLIGEAQGGVSIQPGAGKNISVESTSLKAGETVGGLIGSLLGSSISSIQSAAIKDITIETGKKNNKFGAGGMIGRCNHNLTTDDITIQKLIIKSPDNSVNVKNPIGGLIGFVSSTSSTTAIGATKGINLSEMTLISQGSAANAAEYAVGALLGETQGQNVTAQRILAQDIGIQAGKTGTTQNGYAGGLIGKATSGKITLQYYEVKNSTRGTPQIIATESAGGLIGYLAAVCNIDMVKTDITAPEIERKNNVSQLAVKAPQAGGMVGTVNLPASIENCYEDVFVQKCQIVSTSGNAGGLIGIVRNAAKISAYRMKSEENRIQLDGSYQDSYDTTFAAGGAIGKVESGLLYWSKLTLRDNQIGIGTGDSGKLWLLNNSKNNVDLPADLTESTLPVYANHVGNVVGLYAKNNSSMYVLNPNITYSTSFLSANNRPVTDVGKQIADTDCYQYRNRCHIIDKTSFTDDGIKKKKEEYVTAKNSNLLLDSYRLSDKLTKQFDISYKSTYPLPGISKEIAKPIVVYRTEDGTVQDVVTTMIDMLTNVAGIPASNMPILTVKAEAWLWNTDTQTGEKNPDAKVLPSITATGSGGNHTFAYSHYDAVDNSTAKATYTNLIFTYKWDRPVSGSETPQEIFEIPVFVEEVLEVDVHTRIMEGNVYSVDSMKQNGQKGAILMANDSTYTLYSEYVYNSARKNVPDGMGIKKEFYLSEVKSGNIEVRKKLEPGTALTLVDVTEGTNKAYYYTVPEAPNITEVPYTEFKDADGNPYKERAIKLLQDKEKYIDMENVEKLHVGCEQFLLMVKKPENASMSNEAYSIHTMPSAVQDTKLISKEIRILDIKSIPGLKVSMERAGTDISGTIEKDGKLTEKLVFALKADSLYWAEKGSSGLIDSENHGKYLEVGFYLRDDAKNRVRFPEGTNVRFKIDGGEFSSSVAVPNSSIIYFFKDSNSAYQISSVDKNTEVSVEIELDFSVADFSNIVKEEYTAWIDLLRTVNKDYPVGTDTLIDSYHEQISAKVIQQLGFAIEAKDVTQLGINRYQKANDEKSKIAYITKFDFQKIIESIGSGNVEEAAKKWAGLDYELTFSVFRKAKQADGTFLYEPYSGSDIQIVDLIGNSIGNKITYNFTADQIVKDKKGQVIIEDGLSVVVNSKAVDLTNYKIEAALKIKEKGATGDTVATKDFFIFTVTALKTDL